MGKLMLGVLSAIAWIYYLQPVRLQRAWGRGLGLVLRGLKIRSKVIDENLALVFPGNSPHAREKRARLHGEAYAHLGQLILEILTLFGAGSLMKRYASRVTELRGQEHWREAKRQGKGVLFLSSHVGNWELMAACGGLAGIDLLLVTKRLKPAWVHEAIEVGRAACNVRGTYEPRTFRDVLAHLKRGETVGFVLDQYAGPPVSVRVPFLGQVVGTSTALATIAKRTGAPVLPVVNYRTPDGRLIVEIQPPVSWQAEEDSTLELAVNTARYVKVLEKHVLEHPEQWLWIHRRFKGDLSALREGEWSEGRARK